MPEQSSRDVAFKVIELAQLRPEDLLVDVGAGTGEIGLELARQLPRYVGLDLSGPMLGVFRHRLEAARVNAVLLVADADAPWPLPNASVRAIFGSRSLHLLSTDRLTREALRVASRRGALLIIGRIRRNPSSVNERMRKEMHRYLEEGGGGGRDGQNRSRLLIEALVAGGATAFDPVVAARWTTMHSPADSLRSWKSKPGLGGTDLPDSQKNEILSDLEKWAKQVYRNLETSFQSTEQYLLEGVRLPAA